MNRIVNMHNYKSWAEARARIPGLIYVGREHKGKGCPASPLANKPMGPESNRARSIAEYRVWLWERIEANDQRVLEALRQIGPDTPLACWCAPLPCHSEVVAKAAAWLRAREGK
jgi:hypothetical protein